MKWILVFLPVMALAAPLDISEEACPSQILDIINNQLVCVTPTEEEPPAPEEPPAVTSCPVPPRLNNFGPVINGTYFYDCGPATQLRSPLPTRTYWHLTTYGSTYSMCMMPGSFAQEAWRFPSGNVTINTSDQVLLVNDTILGNLTINGSRIRMDFLNGNFVTGDIICGPNAQNVQINGQCVCP